jgi:transposase-like protein
MSVFKRRRFPAEIILLCVCWYCCYGISYREALALVLAAQNLFSRRL